MSATPVHLVCAYCGRHFYQTLAYFFEHQNACALKEPDQRRKDEEVARMQKYRIGSYGWMDAMKGAE